MLTVVLAKFLLAVLGVVVGIVFGGLPGMTATMAIAIFLPITYAYSLDLALYLLIGLYIGGITGGLIPAILINIPGTPSSICTTFDGYPMAQRNEGERALKIGIAASLFGGLISLVVLYFFTPPLARVAIHFSSIEKFLIILFAMTIIAALSKGNMLKGIFSGFVGVLIALIGQFADNNKLRMIPDLTYFKVNLRGGFQLLPVLTDCIFHHGFYIIIRHIKYIFLHKFLHPKMMEFLKPVLHFLIGICSCLVLKLYFTFQRFCFFIIELCNKEGNQTVKGIFFVAHIIVT